MEISYFLAACLALIYSLWSFAASLWRSGQRKWQLKKGGMALVAFVACFGAMSNAMDEGAKSGGFDSHSDKQAAAAAGIADADQWKSHKQLLAAEAKKVSDEIAKRDAQKTAERNAREQVEARLAEEEQINDERLEAEREAEEARVAARKKETCLQEASCAFEEYSLTLGPGCQLAIEKLAKWDFEWTDSWMEPKFESAGWGNKDKGTLMAIGKSLKLQNGFGAWKRVSYLCEFDPKTNAVVAASAF